MALPEVKIDVNVNLTVDEKALGRALHIVEMWLEDHPDKTIVIEEEEGLRVCLIADEVKGHEAELPGPWISVKERLPEEPGEYLCWYKSFFKRADVLVFRTDKNAFWSYEADKAIDSVTHWMELPEPPKEEANGEEQGE